MKSLKSLFALSLASVAAAKAKVEEAAGSPILDALQTMATDVYESTLGLAQDVAGVALNLVLVLFTSVKDYFQGYLVLPTKIPIINQKLPELLMALRDDLQVEVFDRVRAFKCDKWIIPLEGQTGKPSLKGAVASLAMAMSACMMLSCAPAIHALVKSGADKAGAEAIAYTVGTALGLQYLAKQAA